MTQPPEARRRTSPAAPPSTLPAAPPSTSPEASPSKPPEMPPQTEPKILLPQVNGTLPKLSASRSKTEFFRHLGLIETDEDCRQLYREMMVCYGFGRIFARDSIDF